MLTRRSIQGALYLALALTASCGTEVIVPDVELVRMSVSLSTRDLVVGDTVEIRVVGTNPTTRTLRFTTHACAAFIVRIRFSADVVVFQHPRFCNDIGSERVLEPGEAIEETVLFDGTGSPIGFRDENGDEVILRMAAGTYTVVAAPEGAPDNQSEPVELRIRTWRLP